VVAPVVVGTTVVGAVVVTVAEFVVDGVAVVEGI